MAAKCIFLCGLQNIEVKEDLKEGLQLIPNENNSDFPTIKLTNNKEKIKSLLDKQLSYFIGAIEYNHLLNGYSIVAFAENEFDILNTNSIKHLDLHLFLLKMYFFCLWMTKDNATDFDIGFLQFINKKNELEVSSNNMTSSNFNVSGERTSVVFSLDELKTSSTYLTDYIYIEHKNRPKLASASSLERISIANYFIQSAIVAHDLGIKAVGYCSALETLFANGDNTELSHKLSERVSKFLETEISARKEIYRSVKRIYEIRSKVVHGATFKSQKTTELCNIVQQADRICRRVMVYALTTKEDENIFDKSPEELDLFFLDLILK